MNLPRLPHLQIRILRRTCADPHSSASAVLAQARRALDYNATVEDVERVTGHWPRREDLQRDVVS